MGLTNLSQILKANTQPTLTPKAPVTVGGLTAYPGLTPATLPATGASGTGVSFADWNAQQAAAPTATSDPASSTTAESAARALLRKVYAKYGKVPTDQELQQWDAYYAGDPKFAADPAYSEMRMDYQARGADYGGDSATTPAALSGVNPGDFTMAPFEGSLNVPRAPTVTPFTSDPWTAPAEFKAPTLADLQTDPGYQFQQQEGEKALQRSAAAKGTLLTGGTLQDIQTFANGLASQEFDKLYTRQFGEWKTSYDDSLQQYLLDYNRKFGEHQQAFSEAHAQWSDEAQAATSNYNAALSAYNTEASRRQSQFNNLATLAGLANY